MEPRSHLPTGERRLVSRLHALLLQPGLLHGSLHRTRRRCGKPQCRCAAGDLHSSLQLSVLVDGRQITVHVPDSWEERVRSWVQRDQEIRRILLQLSDRSLKRLRARKE